MKVRSFRITFRRRKGVTGDLFEQAALATGLICGIDEAGCGPLAGPVVAAAVILDPKRRIYGLRDSKVLKPERREQLAKRIRERAIAWAVAEASVDEIDSINILQARLLAMRRAVDALKVVPQYALVDGNQMPRLPFPGRAIIAGDALEPAISAASILAKTVRDGMMRAFDASASGLWVRAAHGLRHARTLRAPASTRPLHPASTQLRPGSHARRRRCGSLRLTIRSIGG